VLEDANTSVIQAQLLSHRHSSSRPAGLWWSRGYQKVIYCFIWNIFLWSWATTNSCN